MEIEYTEGQTVKDNVRERVELPGFHEFEVATGTRDLKMV